MKDPAYKPPAVEISPEVRAELDAAAAVDGYTIKAVRDFVILLPDKHDKADPLGQRGYFGFKIDVEAAALEFDCVWRMFVDGERFRLTSNDAAKELGAPAGVATGWLPNPEGVVLERAGGGWLLRHG